MPGTALITYEGLTIPIDVYRRGMRLMRKYGRTSYFTDWYFWQIEKLTLGLK